MGNPVVHFEILGQDGEKLKNYYSEMFGWEIRSDNPMAYGIVLREENLSPEGIGIGGGIMGIAIGHFEDPEGHMVGVLENLS